MGTKQSTASEPTTTPAAGPTVTERRASPAPLGDTYTSPPPPSSNLSLYSRDNDQYSQQPRIVAIMPQSLPQEETRPRPRYVDVDLLLAELQRMPPLPPPRSPTSSSTRDNQRRERRSHHHRHHHHHHRRHGEGINPLSIPQAASPRLAFLPDLAKSKCPFCAKEFSSFDLQEHMVMCIAKPRLRYNEDILTESAGECCICLIDMNPGNKIARLPCLCVYHVRCIDEWLKVKQKCPQHPELELQT